MHRPGKNGQYPSVQKTRYTHTITPILAQLEEHLPVDSILLGTPLNHFQRSRRQRLDGPGFLTNRRNCVTPHHAHSHTAVLSQIQSFPKLEQHNRKGSPPRVNPRELHERLVLNAPGCLARVWPNSCLWAVSCRDPWRRGRRISRV